MIKFRTNICPQYMTDNWVPHGLLGYNEQTKEFRTINILEEEQETILKHLQYLTNPDKGKIQTVFFVVGLINRKKLFIFKKGEIVRQLLDPQVMYETISLNLCERIAP